MTVDPFATLGIARSMGISAEELETRYLKLSRSCHPDLNQRAEPAEQARILAQAADLNDAYRSLKNPWERARCLIDLQDPQLFTMTKKLAPTFLMTAMELAEDVAQVGPDQATTLRAACQKKIDLYLQEITELLDAEDYAEAAVKLHESKYYRKALADLDTTDRRAG
ncbi:MAG: Fe-S protein assembly co-chaperone HscB [Planctomycetota bacterium]